MTVFLLQLLLETEAIKGDKEVNMYQLHLYLGMCLLHGRYDDALFHLQQALQLSVSGDAEKLDAHSSGTLWDMLSDAYILPGPQGTMGVCLYREENCAMFTYLVVALVLCFLFIRVVASSVHIPSSHSQRLL